MFLEFLVGENEIPDIAFELDLLDKLKSRVQLARRIDLSQHTQKKEKHEKNWLKEAAEALEVDLDSDLDDHQLVFLNVQYTHIN